MISRKDSEKRAIGQRQPLSSVSVDCEGTITDFLAKRKSFSREGRKMELKKRKTYTTWILSLSVALFLAGCSTWGGSSAPPPSPVAGPTAATSAGTILGPRPIYYDFQDIPVPQELSVVQKDSYVFQSGNMKAGLLTLRGRVDINSVINFFQSAMPRENWQQRGGFRYRRSVLIFEKPDKICVIKIYDELYFTYAEIYVAPSTGQV